MMHARTYLVGMEESTKRIQDPVREVEIPVDEKDGSGPCQTGPPKIFDLPGKGNDVFVACKSWKRDSFRSRVSG